MAETTRLAACWASSHIVERVVRAFAEDMHRRGLLPELSEKSCSRTTAALARALGDPNLGALERVLTAVEQTPPADLPVTLSSVDDVDRVCEAAGLGGGDGEWWGPDQRPFVAAPLWGGDFGELNVDHVRGGATLAVITHGAPSSLLWAAIQAARDVYSPSPASTDGGT